jgi:hypothetical protein
MAVKSTLKVVLMADDTVVAESDDPGLWQNVLSKLYSSKNGGGTACSTQDGEQDDTKVLSQRSSDSAISKLASALDVTEEQLIGACRPRCEEPYLTIDLHAWEKYKKGTPARGRCAVGATAVVGTLLALWTHQADLADPSLAQASKVLTRLGARDSYPRRTLKNCEWLQLDGDRIKVNPANISSAKRLARAFVLSNWVDYAAKRAVG